MGCCSAVGICGGGNREDEGSRPGAFPPPPALSSPGRVLSDRALSPDAPACPSCHRSSHSPALFQLRDRSADSPHPPTSQRGPASLLGCLSVHRPRTLLWGHFGRAAQTLPRGWTRGWMRAAPLPCKPTPFELTPHKPNPPQTRLHFPRPRGLRPLCSSMPRTQRSEKAAAPIRTPRPQQHPRAEMHPPATAAPTAAERLGSLRQQRSSTAQQVPGRGFHLLTAFFPPFSCTLLFFFNAVHAVLVLTHRDTPLRSYRVPEFTMTPLCGKCSRRKETALKKKKKTFCHPDEIIRL